LKRSAIKASKGHQVLSSSNGEFEIKSSRYPFCACVEPTDTRHDYPACSKDDPTSDGSIRSALKLVPFDQQLNRLMLIGKNGTAAAYVVTWSTQQKTFTSDQLAHGVNLAEEFALNPFCAAFGKVDAAVAAKQAYETKQIKEMFRSGEAKKDMEGMAARTEQEHQALAAAVKTAFVPVTHTLKIEPSP